MPSGPSGVWGSVASWVRTIAKRAALVLPWVLVVASVSVVAAGCGGETAQARKYEAAGDWEGALAVYEEVLLEHPDDLEALSGAALALMALQRYDEALSVQEQVVAADPKDAQTRIELGFNYLGHQGRPADAARVMGEAAEIEPNARNLTFWAQALEASGDLQGAEDALRRAIAADSAYGYSYSELVELLEEQGRMDEAAEVLDQAQGASGLTAEESDQ